MKAGFNGTEMDFVISVFINGKEYWLHLSLEDINKINARVINEVEIVEADWQK